MLYLVLEILLYIAITMQLLTSQVGLVLGTVLLTAIIYLDKKYRQITKMLRECEHD